MKQIVKWLWVGTLAVATIGCDAAKELPAGGKTKPAREAPAAVEPMSGVAPDARVVARVGGEAFTMDDLDARAMMLDVKPYQTLYETRRRALEQMLGEELLDREAAERGIARDELVELEVTQKMTRPTAEQIREFYDRNTDQMRGRSIEEMSSQIGNQLNRENRDRLVQDLLNSLRRKYAVSFSLEPPRVPVTIAKNDPTKGPAGAPVQLVEFSDFQ